MYTSGAFWSRSISFSLSYNFNLFHCVINDIVVMYATTLCMRKGANRTGHGVKELDKHRARKESLKNVNTRCFINKYFLYCKIENY